MIKHKSDLMDGQAMKRAISRIAHEIIEYNKGAHDLVLIGIKRRGIFFARRIAEHLHTEDISVDVGAIDISYYKDDLSVISENPIVNNTEIPFSIDNKIVVIVDDVIYTGRTAKTAIDTLLNIGKPQAIQLAELIDRGHRILPIKPDFLGKNVMTSNDEIVQVSVLEVDGHDLVSIAEIKKGILM